MKNFFQKALGKTGLYGPLWPSMLIAFSAAVVVSAQTPTARDGVYTAAQALRGKVVFDKSCASCHAITPKGPVSSTSRGPDLGGDEFLTRWNGKPASHLSKIIHDTMPSDFSLEMTEPVALDLTAYLLQVNKFPDGKADLTAGTANAVIILK
jgi:mono/diheme cytochrome c family protein